MSSEVGDAIGNLKYNLNSLWSSPSSVLVTGGFFGMFANTSYFCTLTYVGQRSFYCIMCEVKWLANVATVYICSKARRAF